MKKINFLGLLIASSLLFNILPSSQHKALSQNGEIDFSIGGKGCNSRVEYNRVTRIVKLRPGLELNAYSQLERITCLLRVSSPSENHILVPIAIKGNTRNRGGKMTVAITTNSGANTISTMKRSYTTTGGMNLAQFFEPSDNPQCASSGNFGANISVFGTNAWVDLNNVQFEVRSRPC